MTRGNVLFMWSSVNLLYYSSVEVISLNYLKKLYITLMNAITLRSRNASKSSMSVKFVND